MATTAILIWLLGWLVERGRCRRIRTLLILVGLSMIPGLIALLLLSLRYLVLKQD